MIIRAIKRFLEILKKEAEISKAQRRLVSLPIDYLALQEIADTVSAGYNVEIEVNTRNGDKIIFRKTTSQENNNFKTFAERWSDYQNGK